MGMDPGAGHKRTLTQAQVERSAKAFESLHEGTANLGSGELCEAIEALFEARSDMNPHHLEDLGNKLQRMAWKMEREAAP